MDRSVNIHEAKTHLSRLIERVEAGEEITLARAGRPVARLIPFSPRSTPRIPGQLRGKIQVADDWDSPQTNEAIARLFGQ